LVVEEILPEALGRTKLQLVEGGADVGEAQEVEGLQCSVFSFQQETSLGRRRLIAGGSAQASKSSG
jgi:hypothetical protein